MEQQNAELEVNDLREKVEANPPSEEKENVARNKKQSQPEKSFDKKRKFSKGFFSQDAARNQPSTGGRIFNTAERIMHEKLLHTIGPTYELAPYDTSEKKFSGRNRLYIGNIPAEATDDEIKELFKKFGETSEFFVNREKFFGFVRMDYQFNAEKAKGELNGYVFRGKSLKIRFAPNGSSIKIKNLDHYVSNELLYLAFSVFGDIDRCVVIVDDRGKTTGEGIVEFSRKISAQFAIRKCSEGCFFLTTNLRPVLVENHEVFDEFDGYSDRMAQRKTPDFYKKRSVGPRFAQRDSFEFEYGSRWKQLFEMYEKKKDAIKRELTVEVDKLVAQMEYARYEHETEMLREQLRCRQVDMERQKKEWGLKRKHPNDVALKRGEEEDAEGAENQCLKQEGDVNNATNQQDQSYNNQFTRSDGGHHQSMARGGGYMTYHWNWGSSKKPRF